MRPMSASLRSLSSQKDSVKRGLASSPRGRDEVWQPLAMNWFESWKEYVDFDNTDVDERPQEEIDSLHPGPIDNHSLSGNYGDEMNRNLIEGKDYVLLPNPIIQNLLQVFKGGPEFCRKVQNKGSTYVPVFFVDLYPIRFEFYKWDKLTDGLPEKPTKVLYYPSRFNLDTLTDEIKGNLNLYGKNYRCWVRVNGGNASSGSSSSSDTNNGSINHMQVALAEGEGKDYEADNQGSPKRVKTGRMLTADVTDLMASDFRLLRKTKNVPISDLLGSNGCIEMICEIADSYAPKDGDWPRSKILRKWKNDLRLGDVVDAKDKQGTWYEAVVMEVSESNDHVTVHFKGWGPEFDEIIPCEERDKRIEPLYTQTQDWRSALDEDDKVELKISPPGSKVVWLPALVCEVDKPNQRAQVQFELVRALAAIGLHGDQEAVDLFRKQHTPRPSSSSSSSSSAGDDDSKMDTNDDDATAAAVPDLKVHRWVSLQSEDICSIYTHTPKPEMATTSRSNNGNGNGYSSYNSRVVDRDEWGEKSSVGTPKVRGAVGLQNLGNTCFMNSILQCLSNTERLTDVFTSHRYKSQINIDNALGHGGKLAQVYAKLIKDMWCNSYTKVVPREFKRTIGEFQPQFAGYDQQDSQELMGFLLDGLHEDLNRCKKKPTVSKIESKGRPDDLISREAWRRFLLRNDSELVDRLYGQLKSHVTCTNCKNESVTFDAFNCLSLPIPVKTSKTVSLTVFLLPHGSVPYKVDIEVELTDRVSAVRQKLSAKLIDLGLLHVDDPLPHIPGSRSQVKSVPSVKGLKADDDSTSPSTSDGYDFVTHEDANTQGAATVKPGSSSGRISMVAESKHNDDDDDENYVDSPKQQSPSRLSVNTATSSSNLNSLRSPLKSVPGDNDSKFSDPTHLANLALNGVDDTEDDSKENADDNRDVGKYRPARGQFVFHLCQTLHHIHGRVSKTLEDNQPAAELANQSDGILAFQLAAVCPQKPLSMYNRDADKNDTSYVNYIDVLVGVEVPETYSTAKQTKLEFFARPQRVAITKDITNKGVHELVWHLVKRFISEEFRYLYDGVDARKPYKIMTANTWGMCQKGPVLPTDEVFAVGLTEVIAVHWEAENKLPIHTDSTEFARVRLAEAAAADTDADPTDNSFGSGIKKKKRITIQDCIDKFVEREQLAPEETLYCSNCKKHLAPVKKMDIWAAPDVLIMHLKRFQYIPGNYFVHREKISELVDFPIENLDLSSYVRGPEHPEAPPIYDLYAVSQHSGGMGGGHYTAVCKNPEDCNWYNFNDSLVDSTSPQSAVTELAYVLFYKRRTGGVKWAGVVPLESPGLPDED